MVYWNLHQTHLQEVGLTQISGDHDFFLIYFSQQNIFKDKLHGRFQDKQTPSNNSLTLIKCETCYIKPNPPLFFRQQNMQWSYNMAHSHFKVCLRTQDYIKWLSQHPWYGLWMRVKGPHHYKVTALGSRVKWPLVSKSTSSSRAALE